MIHQSTTTSEGIQRLNQALHRANQLTSWRYGGDVLEAQPVLDHLLRLYDQARGYRGCDRAEFFAELATHYLPTVTEHDPAFVREWLTMQHEPAEIPSYRQLFAVHPRLAFNAVVERTLDTPFKERIFVASCLLSMGALALTMIFAS